MKGWSEERHRKCQVSEPFVFYLRDGAGNSVSMSINRGRQFDYQLEGDFLILMTNTLTLTLPAHEFSKFKDIPNSSEVKK